VRDAKCASISVVNADNAVQYVGWSLLLDGVRVATLSKSVEAYVTLPDLRGVTGATDGEPAFWRCRRAATSI
jgi:hypothetical protein